MADPLMPAFCCWQSTKSSSFFYMMLEIDSEPYNIICLLSAACGILGAVYQVSLYINRKVDHSMIKLAV